MTPSNERFSKVKLRLYYKDGTFTDHSRSQFGIVGHNFPPYVKLAGVSDSRVTFAPSSFPPSFPPPPSARVFKQWLQGYTIYEEI